MQYIPNIKWTEPYWSEFGQSLIQIYAKILMIWIRKINYRILRMQLTQRQYILNIKCTKPNWGEFGQSWIPKIYKNLNRFGSLAYRGMCPEIYDHVVQWKTNIETLPQWQSVWYSSLQRQCSTCNAQGIFGMQKNRVKTLSYLLINNIALKRVPLR